MALDLPDWASGLLSSLDTDIGPIGGFNPSDLVGAGMSLFGGGGGTTPGIVPKTFGINIGGPGGINIGTNPVPSTNPFAGGGGGTSGGGGAGRDVGGGGFGISYHSIRDKMFSHLGFRPRRKTVMYLIRTLGFAVASAVLGLDVNDVLFLFMKRRHSSRRHYVQTMVKAVKRGDRFRRQLAHYGHRMPRAPGRAAAPRRRRRR